MPDDVESRKSGCFTLAEVLVDDFELEAQRDAVNYAQAQETEAKRETIRELNKARRKEGLSALTVPRKAKAALQVPKLEDVDETSSVGFSDSESELFNRLREGGGAKELRYEGRGSARHRKM